MSGRLHSFRGQQRPPRSAWTQAQHSPWTLTQSKVANQTPVIHMAFSDNRRPRHQLDPGCCRVMDLGPLQPPWPRQYYGDRAGHSGQNASGGSRALGCPHGHRWWSRPQASAQLPMTTEATDISSGLLGSFRALDQELSLGHSPGPGISLDLGGQQGHSRQPSLQYPHLSRHRFPQTTKHSAFPSPLPSDPAISHCPSVQLPSARDLG